VSYRFSGIKSVQTYAVTMGGVATKNTTLSTTVDRNYSVVTLTATTTDSSANNPSIDALSAELTSNTNLRVNANTGDASTHTAYVTVTEYFPHAMKQPVQHVTVSGATATITAVGAKAVLFPGGFTSTVGAGGVDNDILVGSELTAPTTVTRRGTGVVKCCVADFK
jgi:hypothetical protein